MRCLNDHTLILYIERALSGRKMKGVEDHLFRCLSCRGKLKKIESNRQSVLRKMDGLKPEAVPEMPFIPPVKPGRPGLFHNLLGPLTLHRILMPAAAAVSFLLAAVLVWILLLSGPKTVTPGPSTFRIHSIRMENQPVQTYIIKEKETKTTIVWVEKKM